MSRWPVARCRRRRSCCRSVPAAATRGPGRRTPSRLRLLLCLIYQLGFRGVAIRVAEENAQLARGRLPWAGSALPLAVLAADGPICQFGRAVYYWHAPYTSREGHGFATMDSSVQISISGKKIPYPPTASTRWLELNYERFWILVPLLGGKSEDFHSSG
uniref:Uncharacterized protein n=1 Tax=Oryza nivara TaxID=4536 RepID=A0A0E0HYY9_ORYNI